MMTHAYDSDLNRSTIRQEQFVIHHVGVPSLKRQSGLLCSSHRA